MYSSLTAKSILRALFRTQRVIKISKYGFVRSKSRLCNHMRHFSPSTRKAPPNPAIKLQNAIFPAARITFHVISCRFAIMHVRASKDPPKYKATPYSKALQTTNDDCVLTRRKPCVLTCWGSLVLIQKWKGGEEVDLQVKERKLARLTTKFIDEATSQVATEDSTKVVVGDSLNNEIQTNLV
jgi:hypothetical protein